MASTSAAALTAIGHSVPAAAVEWLDRYRPRSAWRFSALGSGTAHRSWQAIADIDDEVLVVRQRVIEGVGYVADTQREAAIWQAAARHGIAPPLLATINRGMIWISRYVDNTTTDIEPAQLGRYHARIHGLPAVKWRLDLREQLAIYRRFGLSADIDADVSDAITRLEQGPIRLCHNDLIPGNVLIAGDKYQIIDWEYSAMGSPYFDVAATLAALPSEQHTKYLGAAFPAGPDREQIAAAQRVYEAVANAWAAMDRNSMSVGESP